MTEISKDASDDFIAKWSGVTASELSTAQTISLVQNLEIVVEEC